MTRLFTHKMTNRSYGLTNKGCVRDHNEDNFLDAGNKNLWVLADGAGGHDAGEVASQLIVDRLATVKTSFFERNLRKLIRQSLQQVNTELIELSGGESTPSLIASTVCVLIIEDKTAYYLWSGDSRIYLHRNNKLTQLTKDHNRVDAFVKAGFSREEAEKLPPAKYLTSAVGVSSPLFLQEKNCEIEEGDLFLLCSDGLYNELSLKKIQTFLSDGSLEVKTHNLMNEALSCGAKDNVTVLLVSV